MFIIDEESLMLLELIELKQWRKAHVDSPKIDSGQSGKEITADEIKIENRADRSGINDRLQEERTNK